MDTTYALGDIAQIVSVGTCNDRIALLKIAVRTAGKKAFRMCDFKDMKAAFRRDAPQV